jgi:Putative ER transporter, 6TM, N-terminal
MGMGKCCHGVGFVCEERLTFSSARAEAQVVVRSLIFAYLYVPEHQCSLDPNQPIAPQIEFHVFHGIFLDPASSAVYGVFLFIGTYALGAIRAQLPRLILLTILGSIVLDAVCHFLRKIHKDIDHVIDLYHRTP